ncbi:hypothetical protein DSLPV1_205 [Dishui lake phycodnavirus 1]|uniref:hypothetical protein n=1 Tax=Dishui lake phycodnavirus 1 TaxID=2079134 RepID=UPI000CD69504|nr:hypothetical protein C5Y57_gp193 [Dishui lake phycodnavirus 1]AUT19176.1 hypothetical protein DSLPV1_205 [Dishui lake phycodnavirus 1]
MPRGTSTTREQTWNRNANYPLKLFCWHLSKISPVFEEISSKFSEHECLHVIERGEQITKNEHAIYVINVYLRACR